MTHPMIVKDAKELAGQFYDQERTAKFRSTWPKEMQFVNSCWPRFVTAVRSIYADLLSKPFVKEEDKELMYEALLSDAPGARSMTADEPLQIAPGTQAFEGDRRENFRTDETFGKMPERRVGDLKSFMMRNASRSTH